MPLDPVTVVNGALARLSIEPVQSFSEAFVGSKAALIYNTVVPFLIGVYVFSFAKEMRALTRLSATSNFAYRYVHQLPGDRLGPPLRVTDSVTDTRRRFVDYVLSADQVHSGADPLYGEIKFQPDPSRWSATFAETVSLALAGEFAGTLADDFAARDAYRRDAWGPPDMNFRGGAMGAAIAEDSRATPPRQLALGMDPLTAAHMGWMG